jgi:N-acetylated-alpha-linked acidic dipeptidase
MFKLTLLYYYMLNHVFIQIELASVFGKLLEKGWRPRRTIIFASWDAEEYGLVGSVEWVEDHKEWLEKEGAVYLNVDTAVGGPYFRMEASPAIHRLFYQVTSQVTDPRTGKSVYEVWGEVTNATETPAPVPYIGNLASGSDYVPFMDHVGITSASFAFQGSYGVYHSNYDSFHWMEKFGDPEFAYHKTLCQIWGLLTLRLADDLILPLYPSDYADKLTQHVQDLEAHSHPYTFALLGRAVRKLSKKARKFERKRQRLESRLAEYKSVDDLPSVLLKRLQKANTRLTGFEKGFIDPQGVKGREWFKHVVYAPGLWSAYASQVFPAIVEGLDNHDLEQVRIAESRAVESIKQAKEWLKKD